MKLDWDRVRMPVIYKVKNTHDDKIFSYFWFVSKRLARHIVRKHNDWIYVYWKLDDEVYKFYNSDSEKIRMVAISHQTKTMILVMNY